MPQNIKSFIKANSKYLALFIGLGTLNFLLIFLHYRSFNIPLATIIILAFILEIILSTVILKARSKSWPIEKSFLILGFIVGIIYVFALPIGRAPDEASHFIRIYEITSGHLVSDTTENGSIGSIEPANLDLVVSYSNNDNITYEQISQNLFDAPSSEFEFITTSAYTYNIISYLPQVIATFLGRLLGLPLLICAYFAKLFNFLACFIILYFCIKYIPFLKRSLFFLAFLPISMQAMTSLSADDLAITSSVALFTFVFYTAYQQRTLLTKKQLLLALIICIFLVLSKIVYAPLCLLLFLIPQERFGGTKSKLLWAFCIGTSTAIILLTWHFIMPAMQSVSDSSAQITSIFKTPHHFLASVFGTIIYHFSLYLNGMLGGFLEWFSINLSPIYLTAAIIILAFLCYSESKTTFIKFNHKIIIEVLSALIIFLTFTVMYIQWTKNGELIIDGVQGRYFLPIFLAIPILFLPTKKKQPNQSSYPAKFTQNYYLYGFLAFESVYALTAIACAHI